MLLTRSREAPGTETRGAACFDEGAWPSLNRRETEAGQASLPTVVNEPPGQSQTASDSEQQSVSNNTVSLFIYMSDSTLKLKKKKSS